MNTGIIVQARIKSTRLPSKILKKILGKPILILELERIKKIMNIDEIIVVIPISPGDEIIEEIVYKYDKSIKVFKGSENDVLDRYFKAAQLFKLDNIVRITSDCPLIDPKVSNLVIKKFFENNCDYCSNVEPRTFPYGLETEIFSYNILNKIWQKVKRSDEREHVTLYIRKHLNEFKFQNVTNSIDLTNLRWMLDYQRDFDFIQEVYKKLYNVKKDIFYMEDILNLLKKEPNLINEIESWHKLSDTFKRKRIIK